MRGPLCTPLDVLELARAFMPARTLLTAYELGIFEVLASRPQRADDVARRVNANARSLERLMNALVGLALLEKSVDGQFALTDLARRALVHDSPEYLGGMGHTAQLWQRWHHLTDSVRIGTAAHRDSISERPREWLEKFIAAMHANAAPKADFLIGLLDLTYVRTVLDLGGGSGAYSMAFARRSEQIAPTLFDLPQVIPLATRYIDQCGYSSRIQTLSGDMLHDDLGGPYDLIWVSAIVHMFGMEENIELVRRCAQALNPGGQLVIHDFVMDDSRTNPPAGALFALNMLVNTQQGDSYTEREISDWMKRAGLGNIQRLDTPFPTSLMVGQMPA